MISAGAMLGIVSLLCGAPAADDPAPRFDVVSIKPQGAVHVYSSGGAAPIHIATNPLKYSPGRFSGTLALNSLITEAYRLRAWQLIGPDWLGSERYDVAATMPADTPRATVQRMLQTMLQERFHLAFHREQRETPVYYLTVAKSGLKLERVTEEGPYKTSSGWGLFTSDKMPMEAFVNMLCSELDRPVVNRTGLDGRYRFDLHWTPELTGPGGKDDAWPGALAKAGLKLETGKAPVEFLVVDHVDRTPTEN